MKISTLFLALFATASLHAKVLKCVGTEPFWDATINMDSGIVKIADATNEQGVAIKTLITAAAGMNVDYAFVAKGKYTALVVTSNETCALESDTKFTHSVMMLGYSKAPFFGCCKE